MTLAERISELAEQHGSVRAAGRALKIDAAYLYRLSVGAKTEPSDAVLRKLGLKRVVTFIDRNSSSTCVPPRKP